MTVLRQSFSRAAMLTFLFTLWAGISVLSPRTASAQMPAVPDTYAVSGVDIKKNGAVRIWGGVNGFHVYGLGTGGPMTNWNIEIVREAITNVSQQPISGGAVQGSDGRYLHSLQEVVTQNRQQGKVTILCPFRWTPTDDQMAGKNPTEMYYYNNIKAKMYAIAAYFKDAQDVWLEVWNEPYGGDNDNRWLSEMQDMIGNIRSAGNNNIVLVPGCKWGTSENILLSQGSTLLASQTNKNIVFDLHAYYDWNSSSQAGIENRIQSVRNKNLPLLFAEVGPAFENGSLDTRKFLNAALAKRVTTLGWDWNGDVNNDPNSLEDPSGNPNNTSYNFNWGSTFKSFLGALKVGAHLVDGVYTLTPNCQPGSWLDVYQALPGNGTNVAIFGGSGYTPQAWRVERQSDNSYKVISVSVPGGYCLDVSGAVNADGTNVDIWTDNGTNAQRWAITNRGSASYKLNPKCAPTRSLDVYKGLANGNVQIWTDGTGTINQSWGFVPR